MINTRPATLVVSGKVKRGFQSEYETWLTGVNHEAAKFPGYAGANIIHQADTGEYVLLLWFDSEAELANWQESDMLANWLQKVKPMIEAENIQITRGFEYWFTQGNYTPPRWKQDVVTWIALCPMVYLSSITINPLLEGLPAFIAVVISVGLLVPIVSYGAMPVTQWLLKPWLTGKQPILPNSSKR